MTGIGMLRDRLMCCLLSRGRFDADCYRACNSDLAEFTEREALRHYVHYGHREGRVCSDRSIVRWLRSRINRRGTPVVVVSHEASLTGAPQTALNICRTLKARGFRVLTVLLKDGELCNQFAACGDCVVVSIRYLHRAERILRRHGARFALLNTCVSGCAAPQFRDWGYRVVTLVHEMYETVEACEVAGAKTLAMLEASDWVVFPSNFVVADWEANGIRLPERRVAVMPQGYYRPDIGVAPGEDLGAERAALRKSLGLPPDAFVVLGCGMREARKGADVFFRVAKAVSAEADNVFFVWVGPVGLPSFNVEIEASVRSVGKTARLLPPQDMREIYRGADLFFLPSRADPFPAVALEAANCGLPVVYASDSTGVRDVFGGIEGCSLERHDEGGFARLIRKLCADPARCRSLGDACRRAFQGKMMKEDEYVDILCSAYLRIA